MDCVIGTETEEISPSKENATFLSHMPIKLIDIDTFVLTEIQERLLIMIYMLWEYLKLIRGQKGSF